MTAAYVEDEYASTNTMSKVVICFKGKTPLDTA